MSGRKFACFLVLWFEYECNHRDDRASNKKQNGKSSNKVNSRQLKEEKTISVKVQYLSNFSNYHLTKQLAFQVWQ